MCSSKVCEVCARAKYCDLTGHEQVRHVGDRDNGERMLNRAVAYAPTASVRDMCSHLREQTLALGEIKVPLLAKDPAQVRWEERHANYDEARVPYDR